MSEEEYENKLIEDLQKIVNKTKNYINSHRISKKENERISSAYNNRVEETLKLQNEIQKQQKELEIHTKLEQQYKKECLELKAELERKVKELGKGQHTLMLSRRKWKNRYYKQRQKNIKRNETMEIIKYIDIAFENCEVCRLLPNMLKYLMVQGIKENMDINCYQYKNGETNKKESCEYFSITINEKRLKNMTWNGTLKERLKYFNDIVSIIIHYEHSKEEIYVPWNEEDDYSNKYQTIEETEEGIRIKITKKHL